MVAFAPTVPNPNVAATSDPEYTSYRWSRPIGAFEGNKSTAIAVEGGAKALTEGVNAADTLAKNYIEQGIQRDGGALVDKETKNLEGTLSELRGDGTLAYASADANASTDPKQKLDLLATDKTSDAPADVKAVGPMLDKLEARRANGSISETKFRGDVAAAASQWRAKWPGYVKEIDAEFDRVTQRGVANTYIQNMVRDLDAANTAAKTKQNAVHSLLTHAEEVDHIPGANIWRQKFESGDWSEAKVRSMYNQTMSFKFVEEQAKSKVEMSSLADKTAASEGEKYINTIGSNDIKNFFATVDPSEKPDKILSELRADSIDGPHAELFGSHIDATIRQAKARAMERAMNTKTSDGRTVLEAIGPEKFDKMFADNPYVKMAQSAVDALVGSKDHSAAVLSANSLAALSNDDAYRLATSDTPIGRLYRAEKVWSKEGGMGGKLVADQLENAGLVANARTWMDQGLIAGGAQPDKNASGDDKDLITIKSHYDEAVLNGRQSPAALKLLTDKVADRIKDESIPAKIRAGYAEMAYDGRNLEFLESLEKDHTDPQTNKKVKGAAWFYQNLTSEEHAKAAKALGPEVWTKYQNYVEKAGEYLIGTEAASSAFTNVHVPAPIKSAYDKFVGSRAEPEANFKFSYDNEANQFYVQPTNKGTSGDRPYFIRQQKLMENSVNNINTIIKSVSSMSKISGQDPNVFLYKTLAPLAETEPSVKKMLDALIAAHQETETP